MVLTKLTENTSRSVYLVKQYGDCAMGRVDTGRKRTPTSGPVDPGRVETGSEVSVHMDRDQAARCT